MSGRNRSSCGPLLHNVATDKIWQPAIRKRNVAAAFKNDHFALFTKPRATHRSACAAGHAAHDDDSFLGCHENRSVAGDGAAEDAKVTDPGRRGARQGTRITSADDVRIRTRPSSGRWAGSWLPCPNVTIAHATPMPRSIANDRATRSCLWNCSSGSRSAQAMQRNVPAQNARAAPSAAPCV